MATESGSSGIDNEALISKLLRPLLKEMGRPAGDTASYLTTYSTTYLDTLLLRMSFIENLLSIPFYFDQNQNSSGLPPPGDLQRLPFLNAVIRESLRLRNSPPSIDP
ncbi:conserved hypothetical protein [Microsporum canis CBS 113480]|uniref:Uncharacterized protein n=1 Tax=Arthroderma otae (strain ATCC MYA-4605 / CBS 113480) TaxID=554155 RepID=C5FMX3_ARTOC|nr:conserved hypothetical protein [Microsporum canis CBS 113480]EEQ31209.1 conserved hypothetical protein [Microsporum canis CBS 113480]